MGRCHGPEASKLYCPFQDVFLIFRSNGNSLRLATLGPVGILICVITLVGRTGLELLLCFFSTEPKGALQLQTHAHIDILHLAKLVVCELFCFAPVRHEAPVRDTVVFVGLCNDVLFFDLVDLPVKCSHQVFLFRWESAISASASPAPRFVSVLVI